uniref:Uncharacterized protein n=1 Tax=Ditylenchus dipsaci TaxID=166011 RepID=A0A915E1A4_9BILA
MDIKNLVNLIGDEHALKQLSTRIKNFLLSTMAYNTQLIYLRNEVIELVGSITEKGPLDIALYMVQNELAIPFKLLASTDAVRRELQNLLPRCTDVDHMSTVSVNLQQSKERNVIRETRLQILRDSLHGSLEHLIDLQALLNILSDLQSQILEKKLPLERPSAIKLHIENLLSQIDFYHNFG